MLENLLVISIALQVFNFIALMKLLNQVMGTPSPRVLKITIDGKEANGMQILRDDKKYSLAVTGKNAKGNDAPLDPTEPAVFSLSDDSFGSITDGVFESSGKLGVFTIQAQDDGLVALAECEMVAGPAVSIGISITEQPSA